MRQWYCFTQGQRFGPMGEDALRDWIRQGRLTAAELVWSEGMENWASAGVVLPDACGAAVEGARAPLPSLPPDPARGEAADESTDSFTEWMDYWNRKVRKLTIIDVKLVQVMSMAIILIFAKIFPGIMELSVWWFVLVLVVCLPRPFYAFWLKEDPAERKAA